MRFSLKRGEILRVISDNEPISITALAKKVNLSEGSNISMYVQELEKRGLIISYKEEKNIKRGNPTLLKTTSKAKPYTKEFYEFAKKFESLFGKKKTKPNSFKL